MLEILEYEHIFTLFHKTHCFHFILFFNGIFYSKFQPPLIEIVGFILFPAPPKDNRKKSWKLYMYASGCLSQIRYQNSSFISCMPLYVTTDDSKEICLPSRLNETMKFLSFSVTYIFRIIITNDGALGV